MKSETERIDAFERRQRLSLWLNGILLVLLVIVVMVGWRYIRAQQARDARSLTVSELSVVDGNGVVRARIGGNLPDSVVNGRVVSRGSQAAGVLLYDDTGQERGGYVTWSNGVVGLTLDNRSGQTAEFLADPGAGSAIRLHWGDDAVELRASEDGPSIHAVRHKQVAFHEPSVENPKSTSLCADLVGMKKQLSSEQLLDACRARSSEAACQVCLNKP